MKSLTTKLTVAMALCCAFGTFEVRSNAYVEQLDLEVNRQSVQLDEKYGVLLSWQEEQNLRIKLIANQINKEFADLSATDKATKAVERYGINDPAQQRLLLVELQVAGGSGNGNGDDPKQSPGNP